MIEHVGKEKSGTKGILLLLGSLPVQNINKVCKVIILGS